MNDATKSGLGEALASYQPSSLSPQAWDRFRHDAVRLVVATSPRDANAATICMKRLVHFLADVSLNRPEASLTELLTREAVEAHLNRSLAEGAAQGTVANRQGSLNALLRAKQGLPAARRRRAHRHLSLYDFGELAGAITAAVVDGSPGGVALAQTLAAGMTGHALPGRSTGGQVELLVADGTVQVGGRRWTPPAGTGLPPSGTLSPAVIERARRWAKANGVLDLNLKMLAFTALAETVQRLPAWEAIRVTGLGRQGLSAVAVGLPPIEDAQLRDFLRRPGQLAGDVVSA